MLAFSVHSIVSTSDKGSLIRTGTDPDGNCFFNAYLYSVEAPTYRELSYPKRLKRVIEVKDFFSQSITVDDVLDLVDVSSFETLLELIERHLKVKGYTLPDLSKQPVLSLRSYLLLVYQSYPELCQNEEFQRMIHFIQTEYHKKIQAYVKRDGAWMYDSYIVLFMTKLKLNILMFSHETNKLITHYPPYDGTHSIIMYHAPDHFESMGWYVDGVVTRVFETNDIPTF
jgi:hypothetical protein